VNNLLEPLNEDELDLLDTFLLYRVDDDAETEVKNEGIFEACTLDGFLTAVVSGPVAIQPSRWLPVVWGDFQPVWDNADQSELILSFMVRHMNSISFMLMEMPKDFAPMFMERTVKGKKFTIVDEWCEGYLKGVALTRNEWGPEEPKMAEYLFPVVAFTAVGRWIGHDGSDRAVEALQNKIAPSVRKIHKHWFNRRTEFERAAPAQGSEPMIGRNDPCPCGSGKKFKKCCLN